MSLELQIWLNLYLMHFVDINNNKLIPVFFLSNFSCDSVCYITQQTDRWPSELTSRWPQTMGDATTTASGKVHQKTVGFNMKCSDILARYIHCQFWYISIALCKIGERSNSKVTWWLIKGLAKQIRPFCAYPTIQHYWDKYAEGMGKVNSVAQRLCNGVDSPGYWPQATCILGYVCIRGLFFLYVHISPV